MSGDFDDIRSRQVRFLEESSRLGSLVVPLWPDESIEYVVLKRLPKEGLPRRQSTELRGF
jgi:hypothetical protein